MLASKYLEFYCTGLTQSEIPRRKKRCTANPYNRRGTVPVVTRD